MKITLFAQWRRKTSPQRKSRTSRVRDRQLRVESLENRTLLTANTTATYSQFDVNHDNYINSFDIINLVKYYNSHDEFTPVASSTSAGSLKNPLLDVADGQSGSTSSSTTNSSGSYTGSTFAAPDVNGDGYFTGADLILEIKQLQDDAPIVRYSLTFSTDSAGLNKITSVTVGQTFYVDVYVQDLRTGFVNAGVAGATLDVVYNNTNLVSPTGAVVVGADYPQPSSSHIGTVSAGLLPSITGKESFNTVQVPFIPLGTDPRLLDAVPIVASAAGTVDFTPQSVFNINGPQVNIVDDGNGNFAQVSAAQVEPPTTASITIHALPVVTVQATSQAAAGNPISFNVSLDAPAAQDVTIDFQVGKAGDSAVAGTDYTTNYTQNAAGYAGTVTIPQGQLSATTTINVQTTPYATYQPNKTFRVDISVDPNSTQFATLGGGTGEGVGTINSSVALPLLKISPSSLVEPPTTTGIPGQPLLMPFTVTLTDSLGNTVTSGQDVTINYRAISQVGDTGVGGLNLTTQGVDYYLSNSTVPGDLLAPPLVIHAGQSTGTINIPIAAELAGPDKTFHVQLLGATGGAGLGTSTTAVGTIINHVAKPSASIQATSNIVEPTTNGQFMDFVVHLSAASSQDITLSYSTATIDADPTLDYDEQTNVPLVIPKFTQDATIHIPIKFNPVLSNDVQFSVTITAPLDGSATIGNATGIGTILDVESDKTVRVSLKTPTEDINGIPFTVDPQTGTTTIPGGDIFYLEGYVTDVRTDVPALGVVQAFTSITFTKTSQFAVVGPVEFPGPYQDHPNPTGPNPTLTNVGADAVTSNGVPQLGDSPQLLFRVKLQAVTADSGKINPGPGDASHPIQMYPSPAGTPPEAVPLSAIQFLGTKTLVTTVAPTLSLGPGPQVTRSAIDGATTPMLFNVHLTEAAVGDVVVHYQVGFSGDTAVAGTDYVTPSGQFTIPHGQLDASFPIQVLGDSKNEAQKTLTVKITSLSGPGSQTTNAVVSTTNAEAVGKIDSPVALPTVSIQPASGVQGGTATFTVKLSAKSGQTVTVHYATSPQTAQAGTDYTTTTGTITFLPGQTVAQTDPVPLKVNANNVGSTTFLMTLATTGDSHATVAVGTAQGTINPLPRGSISGYIYNDLNNSGVYDSGDSPIAGQPVYLSGSDIFGHAVTASTVTVGNGQYTFSNLLAGTYTVVEGTTTILHDGADNIGAIPETVPHVKNQFTITLGAGVNDANNNFGEGKMDPGWLWTTTFFG